MRPRMPSESRSSILLTKEENEMIFKLVGSKCQSLATAVVQLFTTEGPAHNQWFKRDTGILCLVKDNQRRSYYFRIYCMQRKAMIWEHQVYSQIEYKSPRPFLHTFEAEECITAFNFASEEEATMLKNNLLEKIELRKQRREERRQKSIQSATRSSQEISREAFNQNSTIEFRNRKALNDGPVPINNNSISSVTNTTSPHLHNGKTIPLTPHKGLSTAPFKPLSGAKKSRDRRKLTKADIGSPQDFKHVSHVGWDANKGFDVENLPEEDMKYFFDKAGVSERQLQDRNTRDFIYDFINAHGGVDAVKEALVEEETNMTTNTQTPSINHAGRAQLPPPVPIRNPTMPPIAPVAKDTNGGRHAAPPPPARAPPPPPPPPQRQIPPPSQPISNVAAPPPPPPPPMMSAVPPMVSAVSQPAMPDMHAALFDSIRGGKSLKHVDVEKKPVVDNKRGDLLSEIRQGIELRSVTIDSSESDRKSLSQTGLAGALARALEERSKVMHSDSSESDADDTTSDGDEWED